MLRPCQRALNARNALDTTDCARLVTEVAIHLMVAIFVVVVMRTELAARILIVSLASAIDEVLKGVSPPRGAG